MNRIAATFSKLKSTHQKVLIPFITAGDPKPELTVPLMHTLVKSGANLIELGVPFSDPMADGPTIQRSSERALVNGVSLTVVNSKHDQFSVAIIPYTYEHTNFHQIEVGTRINLEFDILGKYISRLLEFKK